MATNSALHEPVGGTVNKQLVYSTKAEPEDGNEEKEKQNTTTSQQSRQPARSAAAAPSEAASNKHQYAGTTSDDDGESNMRRYRKKQRVTCEPIAGMTNEQEEEGEVIDLCDSSSDEEGDESAFNNLPDFCLENIFPFLGPLCHRFTAGVNRQFRRVYLEYLRRVRHQLEREEGRIPQRLGNILPVMRYPTSRRLTCSSISTTKLYLEDMVDLSSGPPVMVSAAEAGSVPVLRYLKQQGYSHNVHTRNAAAAMGNLAALDFLYHPTGRPSNFLPPQYYETLDLETTCRFAAEHGQLAVVRYLHEQCGCALQFPAANAAAAGGHLNVLEYFHQMGGDIDISAARCAIVNGHFDVLRFLYLESQMSGDDDEICRTAADCGNLGMLMLLQECGYLMDESVCQAAAWRGFDYILEWITGNGHCHCEGRYHHNRRDY